MVIYDVNIIILCKAVHTIASPDGVTKRNLASFLTVVYAGVVYILWKVALVFRGLSKKSWGVSKEMKTPEQYSYF